MSSWAHLVWLRQPICISQMLSFEFLWLWNMYLSDSVICISLWQWYYGASRIGVFFLLCSKLLSWPHSLLLRQPICISSIFPLRFLWLWNMYLSDSVRWFLCDSDNGASKKGVFCFDKGRGRRKINGFCKDFVLNYG